MDNSSMAKQLTSTQGMKRKSALPRSSYHHMDNPPALQDVLESPVFDEKMMDVFLEGIRKNVILECNRRNMGYQELSLKSNMHYTQIYKILNGTGGLGLQSLIKISYALGLNPGNLIPYNNCHRKTNGERFDELTVGLDIEACNALLEWCAEYCRQMRRIAHESRK